MTRLALGAKCGKPGGPGVGEAALPGAANKSSFSNDASATVPNPTAERPKNWRRLSSKRFSNSGFIAIGSALLPASLVIEFQALIQLGLADGFFLPPLADQVPKLVAFP